MSSTIIDKLLYWHANHADAISHYCYTENAYQTIYLSSWLAKVKSISYHLQNIAPPRSNIAIMLPSENCHDFITVFFATLMSNMVAVPIAPPESRQAKLSHARTSNILQQINAACIISNAKILTYLEENQISLPPQQINLSNINNMQDATEFVPATLDPSDVAFLQYTSGSTGKVKGVMISHNNIMANIDCMQEVITNLSAGLQHVISWLPHYHDMGLIAGLILPIYLNIPSVIIPTKKFILDPMIWLKAITKFRHCISGGPDFAYSLCCRAAKRAKPEALDLSSWDIAFIGAQMIQQDTIDNFTRQFSDAGFNLQNFYPCYGLAESTLFASGNHQRSTPKVKAISNNTKVLSVGQAFAGHEIVIVNPDTMQKAADNTVGEVWLRGPSIAQGYYKNTKDSTKYFNAKINNNSYLRTGDLGLLENGYLYIVGRLKDMIIAHGKNHPCTDLEWVAVQSHPALRENHCAAISLMHNNKNICVIIAEIHPQFNNITKDIQRAITKAISVQLGIKINQVILVMPRALAKTSSGKLRRFQIKADFINNKLNIIP